MQGLQGFSVNFLKYDFTFSIEENLPEMGAIPAIAARGKNLKGGSTCKFLILSKQKPLWRR